MLDLKWKILIPKYQVMYFKRLKNPEGSFKFTWDKSVLKLYIQVHITINYNQTDLLTMLYDYKSICRTVESQDMTGCVTNKKIQNLTHL